MFKYDDSQNLTNPKIMNLFISSLKYQQKQQENKKKNYKKLTNLFSVRVQKYDDSSSHKTDDKLKIRKCDLANRMYKQRHNKRTHKRIEEYEDKNNEYNSESSIYYKDKFYKDSVKLKSNQTRKTFSLTNKHFVKNERSKFLKHKFNKQVDLAKSKKYIKEFTNKDTSVYNSYKSINSTEKKNSTKNSTIINYYLIKNLDQNEDLILYNDEDKFKYDENYKCYYSLDHKSRIIYIKTSPKLLSSLSSLLSSSIVSKKTTKNISNEQSKFTQTPKKENENIIAFDHESIIEKLKNIELLRKEGENTIISLSDDENYSDNN